MAMKNINLNEMLDEAVELLRPGISDFARSPYPRPDAVEDRSIDTNYLRALAELAARLFPVPGLEMDERADEIQHKILTGDWN